MAIVAARNTVFVRNLSPQVSESILRGIFGQCDEIDQVLFRAFPGRTTEYYAQIDFRSSKGVVEGHQLAGVRILGVNCQVSIIDPGSKDLLRKVFESKGQTISEDDVVQVPSLAEPRGVQLEYIRRYREQAEAKRLKTVHVAGLEKGVTEQNIRALCTRFGEIKEMRLDEDETGQPFALVEFSEVGPALAARSRQGFVVDGKVIVFTESKTLVNTSTFAEQSVHFQSPLFGQPFDQVAQQAAMCVQSHLMPKLVKARLAAAEITKEPVPEGVKAAEAAMQQRRQQAEEKLAEEPFQWAGRSEKDLLRELVELGQKPSSRERRRRRDRFRDGSRHRRGRRRGGASPSGGRKRRRAVGKEGEEADATDPAVDVEDLDLAVVPNTELLVLGESSSYSEASRSPSPKKEGAAGRPDSSSRPMDVDLPVVALEQPSEEAKEPAKESGGNGGILDVDEKEEPEKGSCRTSILDVDEKEEWIPPVDVDEEGSCDEVGMLVPLEPEPLELELDEEPISGTPGSRRRRRSPGKAAEDRRVADATQTEASAGVAAAMADAVVAGSPPTTTGGVALQGSADSAGCATQSSGSDQGGQPSPLPPPPPSALAVATTAAAAATARSSQPQWECAACGEVNRARREQCNNCGADAPWITVKSPGGDDDDDVDELSSASSRPALSVSPARKSSVGSVADIAESPASPARSVAESAARSVAASGSAKSVVESEPRSVADLDDAEDSGEEMVDLEEVEKAEQEECQVEAERVRGEIADARARIFHGGPA